MDKKNEVSESSFLKGNQMKILLVSIMLGILGALLLHMYIKARIIAISGGELVDVVAAVKPISSGTVITNDMLQIIKKPQAILNQMAVEANYKDFVIGQKPAIDINKGQVLLWTHIEIERRDTLAGKLKHNERAITIHVDSSSGLEGLISPGDRVDVIGFFDIPGEDFRNTKSVAKVLLQNVSILAVGKELAVPEQTSGPQKENIPSISSDIGKAIDTITLKVSPQEASLIMFAVRKGEIQLVLRSKEDVVIEPMPDVGYDDITQLKGQEQGDTSTKSEVPSTFGNEIEPILPEINKKLEEIIRQQQLKQQQQQGVSQSDKNK